MVLFTACSDDKDDIDAALIEGSWGLVHSEGYDKYDPSDPFEWDYDCDPLDPSSYSDAKIDIFKMDGNKYYQVTYYWSVYSKKWVKEGEGYTFTISGNTITPISNAMKLGLFELKKTSITKPDGSVLVTTTTKVTGKGQIYFVDKFLGKDVA